MVVLPFPNNPTGSIMTKDELEEIASIIRDTNIMVLSDEIYAEMTYGGLKHTSIAALPDMWEHTIIVNGFSILAIYKFYPESLPECLPGIHCPPPFGNEFPPLANILNHIVAYNGRIRTFAEKKRRNCTTSLLIFFYR